MPSALSGHRDAPLGSYRGKPFVVGGYGTHTKFNCMYGREITEGGYHTKTEIFDSSWQSVADYPNDDCHLSGLVEKRKK